MSSLRTLGIALIAAAAVVTPLGLYDDILPNSSMQNMPFTYLQDKGSYGVGTMSQQNEVWFSRSCGSTSGDISCPGSSNVFRNTTDEYGFTNTELVGDTYDITIPQTIKDLYDGGRTKFGGSMSSFWDIHTRQWTYSSAKGKNNDKPFPADTFRMLDSRVLDAEIFPIQGLVVDMINGGIGFRNHSVPSGLSQGAQWTEDLLFLEPESACVDTNLTLEFTLPDNQFMDAMYIQNVSLVDNGGFVDLYPEYPSLSMDDNQANPKLRERAYKAAWLVNVFSALTMNVTTTGLKNGWQYMNSERGKKFPLAPGSAQGSPGTISMDMDFNSLVSMANVLSTRNNSFTNTTTTTGIYQNPFHISDANYSDIPILCQGTGPADYANSSNINVMCGLFYAAAKRTDGKDTLMTEANSTWSQSVYTCASLNKATIKTVTFKYNATLGSDLRALSILNITAKEYASDNDMPLWGIEQPQEPMTVMDINQFWGLISDDFNPADAPKYNLSLKRAPELYLPGYSSSLGGGLMPLYPGFEYIPAGSVPKDILASSYVLSGDTSLPMDYSGRLNLAMFQRWQNLSALPDTVPTILHLIWTDLAANALEGTRGWTEGASLTKRDSSSSSGSNLVPVLVYEKRVQYKWLYAIPAFIALALFSFLTVASIGLSLLKQGPARVRYYLNQLAAGRLLAAHYYPGHCEKGAPTKTWISRVGKQIVDITTNPTSGMGTPGLEQQPMLYGGKPGANLSAVEVTGRDADGYPLTPMSGRNHQGYVKMNDHR